MFVRKFNEIDKDGDLLFEKEELIESLKDLK